MVNKLLVFLDNLLNEFLQNNVNIMPVRFTKFIALFWPNAIIRKLYLKKLGFILGENSYTNFGLAFTPNDDFTPSVITGKNVSIGPSVTFVSNSEPNNSYLLKENEYVKNNLIKKQSVITLEDDVWLGAGCIIMPGVTVKKGSIIGAGAVVMNDTEEFCTYAGVPAKRIKNYTEKQLKHRNNKVFDGGGGGVKPRPSLVLAI